MNETIFSRLFRYRETPKMSPSENYLTEMLAWMIDSLPKFGREYVNYLCGKCKPNQIAEIDNLFEVSTQTQVSATNGFIDMVIKTDRNIGFICEHKVDSPLSENQIQKYLDCSDEIENSTDYQFKTVLLTKSTKQHTEKADIAFTWHDLYMHFSAQLENREYDANESEKILIEQFLMYLTEVGMGKNDSIQIGSVENYCEAMKLDQTLKSIFSDIIIINDVDWELECCGIKNFVSSYKPFVPAKQWGRIGIEFSANWEPSIFAGVILDNKDHKLKEFNNQPQFVVLIDCNIEKKSDILNTPGFKHLIADIPSSENEFKIDKSPQNKWRLLILQKPLKDVLKHNEYEEQKKDIKDEIVSGINLILKYYNDNM